MKMRRASLAALLLSAAPLVAQVPDSARRQATDTLRRQAADTVRRPAVAQAPVPPADQARGVDAEVRIALFDLLANRYVPALHRLQWLQQSPVALGEGTASGALRGRQDVLFLLAESYYRLGMGEPFRTTAQQLLQSSGARHAPLLRAQLLMDAYRRGDDAGVAQYAAALTQGEASAEVRALAALVTGLSAYRQRNWTAARAGFAAAQQGTTPYADYARYMDALALMGGDSAGAPAALTALTQLASNAQGEFAEQVRLTAAMLAYEREQFDQAAQLAGQIPATSGLGAQAMLVRAWALYKAGQIAPAAEAFRDFATRWPNLPERDESRLMVAQAALQLGRTAEAGEMFRAVSDSLTAETQVVRARNASAMTDAARALVAARAAGLLFITDPASGKTIALQDAAGADWAALAGAFNDSIRATAPSIGLPEIVSLGDVRSRVDTLAMRLGGLSSRLFYTPTSATTNRTAYTTRAQALYEADVAVEIARYRLDRALAATQAQLVLLRALQQQLQTQHDSLAARETQLRAAQDSLAKMSTILDAAGVRLRQMFQQQAAAARAIADENLAAIDSVRRNLGANMGETESTVLATETQTAQIYRAVADLIGSQFEGALARHPAFVMRDSARLHGQRVAVLIGETRNALTAAQQAVAGDIARLEGSESERARSLRSALSAAEALRATAEGQVVQLVERELQARATEMLATLQRDQEAAEFGSASAKFFQAMDAGRTPPTTTGAGGSATRPAAPATGTSSGAVGTTGVSSATKGATPNSRP